MLKRLHRISELYRKEICDWIKYVDTGNKRINILWYNQNIKIQNKSVYYKEFYKIRIYNISEFFSEKGSIICFIASVEKRPITRCNWLKWYGLVQYVKQHFQTACYKQSISKTVTFVMASKEVSMYNNIYLYVNQ